MAVEQVALSLSLLSLVDGCNKFFCPKGASPPKPTGRGGGGGPNLARVSMFTDGGPSGAALLRPEGLQGVPSSRW